jgi:hypothetical protein
MRNLALALIVALLAACGGGDPEEAERVDPPKDVCGPERQHCL